MALGFSALEELDGRVVIVGELFALGLQLLALLLPGLLRRDGLRHDAAGVVVLALQLADAGAHLLHDGHDLGRLVAEHLAKVRRRDDPDLRALLRDGRRGAGTRLDDLQLAEDVAVEHLLDEMLLLGAVALIEPHGAGHDVVEPRLVVVLAVDDLALLKDLLFQLSHRLLT